MARRTSALAFQRIQDDGLLGRLQFQVYSALYHHGPLTALEVCRHLGRLSLQVSVSPRMAELKRMGAIEEVGERVCSVTGKLAITWDVTDALPTRLPKKESRGDRLATLEATVADLARKVERLTAAS